MGKMSACGPGPRDRIVGTARSLFHKLGIRGVGVDKIAEYAHQLTFGEISKIDLDGEKAGLVPSTRWAGEKQHRQTQSTRTAHGGNLLGRNVEKDSRTSPRGDTHWEWGARRSERSTPHMSA